MKTPSPRELYLITAYCCYGALVLYITALPWEQAVQGFCWVTAITPLVLLWKFRKP